MRVLVVALLHILQYILESHSLSLGSEFIVASLRPDFRRCCDKDLHFSIREDRRLREWFTEEEIECIAEAAEDHRASSGQAPRSLYGRIVAEADRLIVPETILRRTLQYGLSHYPELSREGHWERMCAHLQEKYAEGGYLRLWIPESPNARELARLREIIRDRNALRALFERLFAEES